MRHLASSSHYFIGVPIKLEVYVRDERGIRYRVHDVAFGPPLAEPGRGKRLSLGDPRARYRLFVPPEPEPMVRVYDVKLDGGPRAIPVAVLSEQFARSGYPARREADTLTLPAARLGQELHVARLVRRDTPGHSSAPRDRRGQHGHAIRARPAIRSPLAREEARQTAAGPLPLVEASSASSGASA